MQPGNLKNRLCCLVAGLCIILNSPVVVRSQETSPIVREALPNSPRALPTATTGTNAAVGDAFLTESQSVPIQRHVTLPDSLSVNARDHLVSIFAREVDLRIVLGHLAEESRVNIVIAENVDAKVTTTLNNVPLWDALDAILRINGLVWTQKGEIIFVTRPGAGGGSGGQATSSSTPGLQLNVFELDYVSSTEVLEVVNGLLSPSGKAFMHAVDKTQSRQTRERIVIEDYPDRLEIIGQYLYSVDNAPLQVLIEAHVLQVTLTDDQRHGVNLNGLLRLANGRMDIRAQGFANGANSPGFMIGLESTDLDGMVEALCSKSNVRTLAAPKVLVVNGQEARIQIGSRFGYFLTTTTQTSSLQSVDFLDIGVVLQVTPTITQHGQVMLSVAPKVSGGRINPDSGLPEEDTTEANTTVLLPDGKGMIIGGLIKESDGQKTSWVPWLGKLPVLRHLFSRSNSDSSRVEVIIALTPHIVPYREDVHHREFAGFHAAANTAGVICASPMLPEYAGEPFDPKQPPISRSPWDANGPSSLPTVPATAFPMLPADGS
jgi:type IV pilus assembly protein PilQ